MNLGANLNACAHSCRYCSIGRRPVAKLSASRFAALVERFFDWQEASGMKTFMLGRWLGYNANHERPILEILRRLDDRGADPDWPRLPRRFLSGFTLGGLPWRSEVELLSWLRMLRDEFGLGRVVTTLAGTGAVHDRWNGKQGNFNLLLSTLRVAGSLGLALSARLLITRSTLPCLAELHDLLKALPGGCWPSYAPLYYSGSAIRYEGERITEEIRDGLSKEIRESGAWNLEKWLSERELVDIIRTQKVPLRSVFLNLTLTDETIDRIEAMSCDDIVGDLEQRTRAAYAAIPSLGELCERYGDGSNRMVYARETCIDRRWFDIHQRVDPIAFERNLTHLGGA
jgi:hypothetical protein